MTKRLASLASMVLLAAGIAAFTGSALAGNGNGTGNEHAKTDTQSASATQEPASQTAPGNSANAPGQVGKDAASSHATVHSNGGGSAIQASTAGVKPANDTAKDTFALATSSQTKVYGNGQTAGEVAVAAGYTGMLHGPGNSQPHKAALCTGHEVDVHALKAKGLSAKCTTTPSTSTPATSVTTAHTAPAGASVSGSPAGTSPGASATAPGQAVSGGVLGVTASGGQSGPTGGVLGVIASAGSGVLPFTGFPLWLAVVVALALIALGLTARHRARVTV
jgi:hypothetical protein